MTFVCSPDYGEPKTPPCCSCPDGCLESDDCDPLCSWCMTGCKVTAFDATEPGEGCCMENDPPPGTSVFSEVHPDYMPMGWPRPRSTDGRNLPTPYIAKSPNELGNVDGQRRMLCIADRRCQVCGEALGEWCVVTWGIGDAVIVDGAAVCPRCWPSALRLCPRLAELWAEGRLTMASVRTASLTTVRTSLAVQLAGMGEGFTAPDWLPEQA